MKKEEMLEALKGGIKGELDSINLYQYALDNCDDDEVAEFLENRVEEEKQHYNYLITYYNTIAEDENIKESVLRLSDLPNEISGIISENFIEQIASKQILFSTLSTAALLEKNSIDFYRKCAQKSTIPELKELFAKLSEWEAQHYDDIMKIQKEAEHEYWQLNDFEPF